MSSSILLVVLEVKVTCLFYFRGLGPQISLNTVDIGVMHNGVCRPSRQRQLGIFLSMVQVYFSPT